MYHKLDCAIDRHNKLVSLKGSHYRPSIADNTDKGEIQNYQHNYELL